MFVSSVFPALCFLVSFPSKTPTYRIQIVEGQNILNINRIQAFGYIYCPGYNALVMTSPTDGSTPNLRSLSDFVGGTQIDLNMFKNLWNVLGYLRLHKRCSASVQSERERVLLRRDVFMFLFFSCPCHLGTGSPRGSHPMDQRLSVFVKRHNVSLSCQPLALCWAASFLRQSCTFSAALTTLTGSALQLSRCTFKHSLWDALSRPHGVPHRCYWVRTQQSQGRGGGKMKHIQVTLWLFSYTWNWIPR